MVNESAPTSLTIAVETIEFIPWISDTTVTIDVTATMLPSTVMNERSLFDQTAPSAMPIDSKIWFTSGYLRVTTVLRAGGSAIFTCSPSASSRTDANGPVIT